MLSAWSAAADYASKDRIGTRHKVSFVISLPKRYVDEVRKVYEKTSIRPYYGYHSGGHTMDYVLRQGETFTRW